MVHFISTRSLAGEHYTGHLGMMPEGIRQPIKRGYNGILAAAN
jgi:hypothetical protein